MRRALLRNIPLYTRTFLSSPTPKPTTTQQNALTLPPYAITSIPTSTKTFFRFFSSDDQQNDSSDKTPTTPESSAESEAASSDLDKPTEVVIEVEDVDNKELKARLDKFIESDYDHEALSSVFEGIMTRKLTGKHEDTDDELVDNLQFSPIDGVKAEDFEEGFESAIETDDDIPDLYSTSDIVVKKLVEDEFFNMDAKKWDDMIQEATQKGLLNDMKECEDILEDMLHFDKLLPDDIKKKVQKKFDELGDKCESKELEPEEAYKLFAEFEDQIVQEYMDKVQQEKPSEADEVAEPVKIRSDDPPGVGPILKWQSRAVFAPGGDAWHPKNRKVKLSVKVKELGLSKYQFRRLREIVGMRYHPGRDELTITSERFEHREENRKDCLRTLLSIVEEAGKANAMVEDTRTAYVKQRLKANPAFMARLLAKTKQATGAVPA